MAWEAAFDPRAWSVYAAALLMVGLAAWLLALDFASRVNRAFALFLVARAGTMAISATSGLLADPVAGDYWSRVAGYFYVAAFFAFLRFVSIYPRPLRGLGTRAGGLAILAAAVAAELAYAADKCAWSCPAAAGSRLGPLSLLSLILATGLAGLALVAHATRAPAGPRRESMHLVGGVLVANAAFDGVRGAADLALALREGLPALGLEATPWAWGNLVAAPLALVPAGVAVALFLARSRGDESARLARPRLLAGVALALASGAIVGFSSGGFVVRTWGLAVLGLWRLAIPAVVTFAILRHQLFGLDVKVQRGLRRGAVVGAFALVFFLTTELAANYVQEQYGTLIGLAAAGALALAIRPLERTAERFARAVIPHAQDPRDAPHDEREEVYRTAVARTLADAHVTPEEERYLERLARALGIDAEKAARIRAAAGKGARVPS